LGKIFRKNSKKPEEKRMLSAIMTGEEFYHLKGVIDVLLNSMGISDVWYDDYKPTPEESKFSLWHPKKCAEIKIGQIEVGFLGELSGKISATLKLVHKVIIFDLNFEKLSKLASEEHEFRPIPKYPSAVRDLAILVPGQVKVEEVLNVIETTGGALIRDIDLFDIYEGEELPGGKKNLAFHLIYQAEDHTLSFKEIDEIHNKIIKTLENEPDWTVRK
jgi:phenylalanyl-tRNA synthetase beta chain